MKEKIIKEQEYKSTKNAIDLSDNIIKKLEEKEKELKEVDSAREEKSKEIRLFYDLNDEIEKKVIYLILLVKKWKQRLIK